jgi:hypothetical protein
MRIRSALFGAFFAAVFLLSAGTVFSGPPGAPQATATMSVPDVKCVIGLEGVKPNSTGTLSVDGKALHFDGGKKKSEISIASIEDMFTGGESRQDVTGLVGTGVKAAIPYGGGRVVSLFSHKVEVLTVDYKDSNGGFHGAVFVLPAAHASAVKKLLMDQGAHASRPPQEEEPKEKKP